MADASPPPADMATPEEARLLEAIRAGREAGNFERLEAAWLARSAWPLLAGLYRERAAAAPRMPWRVELLARLAELLEAELGDLEGAAQAYGDMSQAGDEEALEEQLRLLRARGDRSGAWRALDLAVERARVREARCSALMRRGEAALEAGELASARADFSAVLSLEPGHLDALSGLARLLPPGEPPAPLLALEQALQGAPRGPAWEARLRLLARLADGRADCPELSLRAWQALAGPQLGDAEATERLTQLLSAAGLESALVPVLQARIARVPRGEGARALRQRLVRALDALGREAEAVEALRDAVRAEPGNHAAWLELSDRAEAASRYAEYAWALEHAATSTVEPAARARLWRRLGAFLERVPGKQEEARACVDRADRLERAVRTGATALGPLVSPPRPRAGQGEQPSEDRVPTEPRPPPPPPPKVFVDITPVMPRRGDPEVTPVRPLAPAALPVTGRFEPLPGLAVGPEPTPIQPLPPGAPLPPLRERDDGGGVLQGRPTGATTPRWPSPYLPEAGPLVGPGDEDGNGAFARATTDPGMSFGQQPPLEVPTDPGLSPAPALTGDARFGERPTAEIPTVVPASAARAPGLPHRLLESADWHAHAEARARAGDGWLAALSREVALALEGVGGPVVESPRWLMGAGERAQLMHPGLEGPIAELLALCGAELVAAARSEGLPPPAVAFTASAGVGARAALEALAASVRLLGLPAPNPECMALAGPPFALAAGVGTSTRLQVGALALGRTLPGGELRFFAGRALLTQHPLLRELRLVTPEELESLLALLPEALRGGRRLSDAARALRAHLPEPARAELRERVGALGEELPLDELAMAARHAANRAGLAACGGVGAAVLALRSKRALDEEVEELLRFAASDGWRELSAAWGPLSALPAAGR